MVKNTMATIGNHMEGWDCVRTTSEVCTFAGGSEESTETSLLESLLVIAPIDSFSFVRAQCVLQDSDD